MSPAKLSANAISRRLDYFCAGAEQRHRFRLLELRDFLCRRRRGGGMTVNCQKCGKPTTVPKATLVAAAENAVRISDLQHQLKENESQRTEITSYINQLSIQLHRWQLRLQSLNEPQQKLETELAAARGNNS